MKILKKQKIDFRLEAKKTDEDITKVYMYGDIVDEQPLDWWSGEPLDGEYIFPEKVRNLFDEIETKNVELHINSYGGSVFASVAIFNYLNTLDKDITVIIDGLAASGASLIAMAGKTIKMPKNTVMMIHRASTFGYGNCNDLREVADTLEKLDNSIVMQTYLKRFKGTSKELHSLVDSETWLSAQDCFNNGLCDEIIELKTEKEPENKKVTEQEITNGIRFMKNFANLKFN